MIVTVRTSVAFWNSRRESGRQRETALSSGKLRVQTGSTYQILPKVFTNCNSSSFCIYNRTLKLMKTKQPRCRENRHAMLVLRKWLRESVHSQSVAAETKLQVHTTESSVDRHSSLRFPMQPSTSLHWTAITPTHIHTDLTQITQSSHRSHTDHTEITQITQISQRDHTHTASQPSRRVGVGSVYWQLATVSTSLNKFVDNEVELRLVSGVNAPVGSRNPAYNFLRCSANHS